ncbi:MAG: hypothetical protein ACKO3N_10555 [Verrucomicrobiota bacterium]
MKKSPLPLPGRCWPRIAATAALIAAATSAMVAGPKGEITVRQLGDARITVDGNLADWPLAAFKAAAQQPLFPQGQQSDSTSARGDHLIFDPARVGLFNGTGPAAFVSGDNDFGVATYFAYDLKYLYVLAVVIDDTLRDDRDTSPFGTQGFFNDGFEFFLDTKGDSTDCISDNAFPSVDEEPPNSDDFQVTVALNAAFKPAGAGADVLGARQTVERAGNPELIGAEKGGPGGLYRDQLDLMGGPDIAARKYADLRAAGARNPELAAKPSVKFSGYVIEMRVPLRNRIPGATTDHPMGFEIFWRDVDKIGSDAGGADPGAGGGDISWATWAQSTAVDCSNPAASLFNSANWGQLVFDKADPLVPVPAGKPSLLFVTSTQDNAPNADGDLVEFLKENGYGVVPFTSNGSSADGLRQAAAKTSAVFISESIGSTSVVDPPGQGTGVFSLKGSDIPVISFEAFMFDNADWVKRTEDGSNDFVNWGNTGRAEVDAIGLGEVDDSLYIQKPGHPIAKGLSGKLKVYNEPYSFTFGLPSADADVVASVDAAGKVPTLFVYEKGDRLPDGSVAPNKRIGLFLGQAANPNANYGPALANLTAAGKQLLLNTIAYVAPAAPPAPVSLGAVRLEGASVVLSWQGGNPPFTIQDAGEVAGPWSNLGTTSDRTSTQPAQATRRFFRVLGQ